MSLSKTSKPRRGRPPRTHDDAESRKRLIRTGLILLTERGYSTSGVNDVIAAASVPKGCFYHYFKNKADFGNQLIDAYQNYFSSKLDLCFNDETLSPLQRLQAFIDNARAGMEKHRFKRGCLVGNLGQEMGTLPEEFRKKLVSIFHDWQSRTEACLALAKSSGEMSSHHDPQTLAHFFWIGWEGAVLRAKLEQSAAPLITFSEGFFSILKK